MISWTPLESNPEVFSELIKLWGLKSPNLSFIDIYSLDEETLEIFSAGNILSVIFVYPVSSTEPNHSERLWLLALIHSIANNPTKDELDNPLKEFIQNASKLFDPKDRGILLESQDKLKQLSEQCAVIGQTDAPDPEDDVDLHFITFINCGGRVVELDGRKEYPVDHGVGTSGNLLKDAASIIKIFIQDTQLLQFNVIAFVKE